MVRNQSPEYAGAVAFVSGPQRGAAARAGTVMARLLHSIDSRTDLHIGPGIFFSEQKYGFPTPRAPSRGDGILRQFHYSPRCLTGQRGISPQESLILTGLCCACQPVCTDSGRDEASDRWFVAGLGKQGLPAKGQAGRRRQSSRPTRPGKTRAAVFWSPAYPFRHEKLTAFCCKMICPRWSALAAPPTIRPAEASFAFLERAYPL